MLQLILGEFDFVIISAEITVQNSVRIFFCNFPCFYADHFGLACRSSYGLQARLSRRP